MGNINLELFKFSETLIISGTFRFMKLSTRLDFFELLELLGILELWELLEFLKFIKPQNCLELFSVWNFWILLIFWNF